MPAVSEQFTTYRDFASANLNEIYGDKLEKAYKVTANHLKSGVWINQTKQGKPLQFQWLDLPWKAQLSPINAIAAGDFDGDGNCEIVLATNHFTNWLETGVWRGTPGLHLTWDKHQFRTRPHAESGIVLPNDTKAILSIDTNSDGKEDILAGQNNDSLLLFKNQ